MSDLIDRKEMLRTYQYICDGVKCFECVQFLKSKTGECPIQRWINNLPSAESEIIRCRDCKHHDGIRCFRWNSTIITGFDDFCSNAERRTDE